MERGAIRGRFTVQDQDFAELGRHAACPHPRWPSFFSPSSQSDRLADLAFDFFGALALLGSGGGAAASRARRSAFRCSVLARTAAASASYLAAAFCPSW